MHEKACRKSHDAKRRSGQSLSVVRSVAIVWKKYSTPSAVCAEKMRSERNRKQK